MVKKPKQMLNLDLEMVKEARLSAAKIAKDTQNFIDRHTTVSVERTVARLLGIDGVDKNDVPLPNVIVDSIHKEGQLGSGIALFIGNAMLHTGKTPMEIASDVADGNLDLTKLPMKDSFEIELAIHEVAKTTIENIRNRRSVREEFLNDHGDKEGPYLYVIVATGNIYEDITQAVAAAKQGADIIAVIRTTGQSLLDYVPYGVTTEGFGGTYATQENFKLMREALDKVSNELGRYVRLCNYCSGLCMPEIAAMGH